MNSLSKMISRPFEYCSSKSLFIVGVIAFVGSSLLAYYGGGNFQDLISVKRGANSSVWISFYNNGMAIVLWSAVSFAFVRLRKSRARLIDVVNVVMISRLIIYMVLMLTLEPFFIQGAIKKAELAVLDNDFLLQTLTVADKTLLMVFGFLSIALLLFYFYFLISGLRFIMNSKQKIDVLWILLLFFGLEVAFVLFHINIY